jgi:membrane fusion protein, multidrug efflux system
VKPIVKYSLWTLAVLVVLTTAAAPKVLPLLQPTADARAASGQEKKASRTAEGGRAPLAVAAFTVQPTSLAETVTSTGTLLAEEGVELQAEINGKIVAIHFTEGARVRKGELLVKLNDADLLATHARAKYRKELGMLRERRMAQLLKQGVARQEEYDTALSELNIQDSEIALTEAQIAKTEIRAPFDGVVGLRYVSEGAFVNAAARIATLQRLDRLKVDFSIPEKYAGRVRIGSPIAFTVAGSEEKYSGEIYAYDPRIEPTTRTVLIRARGDNPRVRLLPGAFANVQVTLGEVADALLVPAVAVIPGLNEKSVFVIEDGKAQRRAVEIGTRTESTVQITAGLKAGDVVITSGLQQMRAGLPVTAAAERT